MGAGKGDSCGRLCLGKQRNLTAATCQYKDKDEGAGGESEKISMRRE